MAFGGTRGSKETAGARTSWRSSFSAFRSILSCLAEGSCDQYATPTDCRHVLTRSFGAGARPDTARAAASGRSGTAVPPGLFRRRHCRQREPSTVRTIPAVAFATRPGRRACLPDRQEREASTRSSTSKGVPHRHHLGEGRRCLHSQGLPEHDVGRTSTETGAGDKGRSTAVKSFISAHPNLKGLISIAPTEAYVAAEAITQAGRIGQVFSASNGGDYLGPSYTEYIRSAP